MTHYVGGEGKSQFARLMNNEKFTAQAVKDMETHGTSAWLVNTLNVKQRDVPSLESLFKTEPSKTQVNANSSAINSSSKQAIQPKQPRSRPVELLEMQKRAFDGETYW
jgi:hypothetical protein